jgi:hypothetical protein
MLPAVELNKPDVAVIIGKGRKEIFIDITPSLAIYKHCRLRALLSHRGRHGSTGRALRFGAEPSLMRSNSFNGPSACAMR